MVSSIGLMRGPSTCLDRGRAKSRLLKHEPYDSGMKSMNRGEKKSEVMTTFGLELKTWVSLEFLRLSHGVNVK